MKAFFLLCLLCLFSAMLIAQPTTVTPVADTVSVADFPKSLKDTTVIQQNNGDRIIIVKNQVTSGILGKLSVSDYLIAFFFVFLGLLIRNYFKIRTGIKTNEKSPPEFSAKYWYQTSFFSKMYSLLMNMVIVFICLRFSSELFGYTVSAFTALLLGLGFDYAVDYLRKRQDKLRDQFAKSLNNSTVSPQ